MQGAGLNAEQLRESLSDAFFTGDLGAGEFLNSLTSVNDLFANGIQGAVGATDIAFQNLITGGLQSGQQALDALGDIGAEAAEANISSFQELQNVLAGQGFDTTQIQQLFTALQTQGISTIEALQNIELIDTANVVNNLQNTGFAFDSVREDVDRTIDRIEEFRASAERDVVTNYRINVEVSGDEVPQGFTQAGGLDPIDTFSAPAIV